jgi:hypothetical protein
MEHFLEPELAEENIRIRRKPALATLLSTTNTTRIYLGLNAGHRGEKLATSRQN